MTVYVDTSVVLSKLLNQPTALQDWGLWESAYAGVIARVEFFRTVDRLRLESMISDEEPVTLHQQFRILWDAMHRIPLSDSILERAEQPFPTVLGTLDAIHLASAITVLSPRENHAAVFLTHDTQLARAAQSMGYQVDGISEAV